MEQIYVIAYLRIFIHNYL